MRRALCSVAALAAVVVAGGIGGSAQAAGARPLVIAITLNSEIDPVSASFVADSIDRARSQHAAALVIQLDTPGGLSTSMNDIVEDELSSPVPVIVYVTPAGARAASAGSVITMASDVAAMAPATHIGAATPIDASGQNIGSDLRRKILNDAEKQMQSLAQSHERNPTLAVQIVSKASEFTDTEALHQNLVEFVAPNLTSLLNQVDGTTTTYTQKRIVLHTAGAQVEAYGMPWTLRLLEILIDPNLLYILFLAGIGGIAYEVFHPGVILPGTLGAVSLLLALFGFSIVPIDWAGAALIAFGVVLLLLEAFVTSHGLIGLSGVIAICVGGLMLFRAPGEAGVSPLLVILFGGGLGVLLAVIATKVLSARRAPVSVYAAGPAGLLGQTAIARTALRPDGQVFVHGELWKAHADETPVAAGRPVVIKQVDGLLLHVAAADESETEGAAE